MSTDRIAVVDDGGRVVLVGARLVGAVADTVLEVVVGAETLDVGGGAAERLSLAEHVADAHLTACRELREVLGNGNGGEKRGGDSSVLHLDDWVRMRRILIRV